MIDATALAHSIITDFCLPYRILDVLVSPWHSCTILFLDPAAQSGARFVDLTIDVLDELTLDHAKAPLAKALLDRQARFAR
jgi:hypothetical protein